jgi:uncharacterized membrane protein HdeD (DUF308 family)
MMVCVLCASFSISGGCVLISNFKTHSHDSTYDLAMTCGVCAIINGVVMLIDMLVDHLVNNDW